MERFNKTPVYHDHLGPGSYFRDTNFKGKKRPKSRAPFNSKSERNLQSAGIAVPGPGLYNPDKHGKKKVFATKTIFATSSKRDTGMNKIKESNPGPGSYLEVRNNVNLEDPEIRYKYNAAFKATKGGISSNKDTSPVVGTYNPY